MITNSSILLKYCLERASIWFILLPLTFNLFSCIKETGKGFENQQTAVTTDSLLLGDARQILYLADNVSVDSARRQLQQHVFDSLTSSQSKAKYHYLNGYLLDYEGKLQESVESYKSGIELLEAEQEYGNIDLAILYNDLAYVYGELNIQPLERVNYRKAFEYVHEYHSNDQENFSSIYMNYMQAVSEYGDGPRARELRALAKNRLESVDKPLYKFRYYLAEGAYLKSFPDKPEIKMLNKSLADYIVHLPDSVQKAYANYSFYTFDAFGYGLLKLKDFDGAQEIFEHLKMRTNSNQNTMKAESNLAAVFLNRKEHLKAAEAYYRSFDLLKSTPNDVNSLMLLSARSQMLSRAGFQKDALKISESMWNDYFKEIISPEVLSRARFQENSNRWLYILVSSAEVFRRAYQVSEKEESLEMAGLFAQKASQMFAGYYSRGFFHEDLNEHYNSITEELLHYVFLANPTQEETTRILNQIENNQSAYVWNKFLLRQFDQDSSGFEDFSTLQYELSIAETEEEKQHLWRQEFQLIEDINPVWAGFVSKQINLSEIKAALTESQSLIRYIITKNEVWAYQIKKNQVKLVLIGDKEETQRLVQEYFESISQREENYEETSQALSQLLLNPFDIESTDFTIIPDDFLAQLPFETLGKEALISKASVRYLNDLKFFDVPASSQEKKLEALAFAPDYKNTKEFSELASTREEAQVLKDVFKAMVFEGNKAIKKNFIDNSSEFSVIHLAMHAISDTVNYGQSSLVFDDAEKLTFDEISTMDIPAEMVVLSACNTGNGKQLPGEGLMSLSRALTLAGSRSLLHTLWEIPDTESAEIMQLFYANLANGMYKNDALAEAKRTFIKNNPLKKHPWYWAGFVLNGETKSLEIEKRKDVGRWLLFLLPFVLFLAYLIFRSNSSAFSRRSKPF